jgi:hypothetical protein
MLKALIAKYESLVLQHRFARYNKGIVVAVAAFISALSLYYGNDSVSTVSDALGVFGVILTPNAEKTP